MHKMDLLNKLVDEKSDSVTATAECLEEFAKDVMYGARRIAKHLYNNDDDKHRRKIYHLAETSRIPIFRLGTMLCARRSVLLRWIAQQESRGW